MRRAQPRRYGLARRYSSGDDHRPARRGIRLFALWLVLGTVALVFCPILFGVAAVAVVAVACVSTVTEGPKGAIVYGIFGATIASMWLGAMSARGY